MSQNFPHTLEVWTEGKTDWIHLKTAMRKLGLNLPIVFRENKEPMGDGTLLNMCQTFAEREKASPVVFIFDHDKSDIIQKVNDPINSYKSWGNEVYSFSIPVPSHRKGYSNICIEMFYTDSEIYTKDSSSRRLYLTSEFHPVSGRHREDKTLSIGNKAKLKNFTATKDTKIVDSEVYDQNDNNVALTKADFADAIATDMFPFDFSPFKPIFDTLTEIIRATRPANTVYFPDFDYLFQSLSASPIQDRLCILNNRLFQLTQMILQIFSIATLRAYEQQIVVEEKEFRSNAKDIKKILNEEYFYPSLKTAILLAKKCFYLIDKSAPEALLQMRDMFKDVFVLGALGQVLEDLESMYPPPQGRPLYLNKSARRDDLLSYFEELATYEKRSDKDLAIVSKPFLEKGKISPETWYKALVHLTAISEPILSRQIVFRNVQYVDPISGEYNVEIVTYGNRTNRELIPLSSGDLDDGSIYTTLLELEEDLLVPLYPMLIVKDDALYTYKRSRSAGYEYYSVVHDRIHIERTKKKLYYSIFRTGARQELFWTSVPPTTNPNTNIRANIPQEGLEKFVGRREQQEIIKDILGVPNENGIVYGPGGIGKTALIQKISMCLFEDPEYALYNPENIIWVSAKTDLYDPHSGTIEPQAHNFTSFDDIVTAILEFFELETLHEYSLEEKKDLVLDVFLENPTLLILDNFETIQYNSPKEATEIIDFFGKQVKRYLRNHPNNYKIIVTSREQIPSGFQQIALKGLDPEDADELLDNWLEWYGEDLTRNQRNEIYEATRGVPIVIKHCLGQLFEFRRPISQVLRELAVYDSDIVQFSYKEILGHIELDNDKTGLRILLLLKLVNPLTIDQFSQLLNVSKNEIEKSIAQLSRFQCIEVVYESGTEKYQLNREISNFARALSQKHKELVEGLQKNIIAYTGLEFEASNEELIAVKMFETYIQQGNLAEAQTFISEKLSEFKDAKLLNYHYASFLIKQRHYETAINILEAILEQGNNNQQRILLLLIEANSKLSQPKYEQMEKYVILLQTWVRSERDVLLSVASFYRDWALWMKSSPPPDLSREKFLRIEQYKEIANKGLDIVTQTPRSERYDKEYFIISQCRFCQWEYKKALEAIDSAITLASSDSERAKYHQFRNVIIQEQERYHKSQ